MARTARIAPIVLLALLLAACGGQAAAPTPTVEPTAAPTVEPTAAPTVEPTPEKDPLAIDARKDVKKAAIQIRAKGTFVQPGETTSQSFAGSGSGFIISSDGIAITNNHVVTGAALIEVYIGGDSTPHNATVLGVSECSDLAVIKIEGDGYPYLQWYAGDISAGMDVYTAGFPLGDPEFTITKGVVSKEKANGNSSWASVERVIEHDATIRPGNSGGPLVDDQGHVLAINYAGSEGGPYYAIGRDEARSVIKQLSDGQDVTSLGINGEAIKGKDISGIWISSIKSGSPMDKARVQPGDFITKIEGLAMGADGTMADYCQILRTHKPSDTLSIEVYRPGTNQLLDGQINGRELAESGPPAPQATSAPAADATAAPATPPAASDSQVSALSLDDAGIQDARTKLETTRGGLRELVFETFDRGNTTRGSWSESKDSILRDNFYRLRATSANSIRPSLWRPKGQPQVVGTGYIVEVDTAFDTGGVVGGVGLVFEAQDADNYLSFQIFTDNTWQVFAFKDGQRLAAYTSKAYQTTAIFGDRPNNLRVERLSDGAILWINNTPVGLVTGSPFSGGSVGVSVYGGANVSSPISVIVDNFRVLAQ